MIPVRARQKRIMLHLVEEPHDRNTAAHKRIIDMTVRTDVYRTS